MQGGRLLQITTARTTRDMVLRAPCCVTTLSANDLPQPWNSETGGVMLCEAVWNYCFENVLLHTLRRQLLMCCWGHLLLMHVCHAVLCCAVLCCAVQMLRRTTRTVALRRPGCSLRVCIGSSCQSRRTSCTYSCSIMSICGRRMQTCMQRCRCSSGEGWLWSQQGWHEGCHQHTTALPSLVSGSRQQCSFCCST